LTRNAKKNQTEHFQDLWKSEKILDKNFERKKKYCLQKPRLKKHFTFKKKLFLSSRFLCNEFL
jgi:hypothetical protein